jgi:hypothetical protein
MICCLCHAVGEFREGRIPNGGGFPQCARHRADSAWRPRQPQPPCVVTWPPSPEQAYQNAMALAALDNAPLAG